VPSQTWSLNERDVAIAIKTALDKARSKKISITVAVVERGGHLIGQSYMDGAKLPSTHLAFCKAWTSAMLQRPSGDYSSSMAPGGGAYALWNAFPGRMVPVGGGVPIIHQGVCLGAVGISGGSAEDDTEIATEAVTAIVDPGR
jgi:uncharacterized protein GlcG (DUF336 family)